MRRDKHLRAQGLHNIPADAGTCDGQTEPVQTAAVKMLLLTDASMPEDVIHDLTKTFRENLPGLGQAHAVMKAVTPDTAASDLSGIPLHPGAENITEKPLC